MSTHASTDGAAPLVTVIVGCYNHARFAEECLDAVRNQTYQRWELLIFDDSSKDTSAEVIEKWIDRHNVPCTFLRHAHNVGVCRSLNEVIRLARGKYISLTSADDVWLPDKLETQVALFETLPEAVGVVYSDAYQIDEDGRRLPKMFIEAHRSFKSFPKGNIHDLLWDGNFIPSMTTLIRRQCYESVGLYDESLAFEDWDMWLRISEEFEFFFSPRVSAHYRIVASSMIRSRRDVINDSLGRISAKFLTGGKLRGRARAEAVKMLSSYADALYRRGDPQACNYLRLALRHNASLRLAAAYVLDAAGVPASSLRKPYRVLRELWRRRLRRPSSAAGGG